MYWYRNRPLPPWVKQCKTTGQIYKNYENSVTSSEQNHALITFSFFDDPISTAQLVLPLIEQDDDADNN